MREDIQVFKNADFGSVRTISIKGEPYFVGKDVAEILGYERRSKAVVTHVDEDDRKMLDRETQSHFGIELGQRGGWLINESGLYSLILSSKLPSAKKFKHWVTSEVLPTIRKHGLYAVDDILDNPEVIAKILMELKQERDARKNADLKIKIQAQQIDELQPKATYYDRILNNKGLITVTQIAKDYGMTAREFNQLIHELGVQYKFRKTWLLYKKYSNKGYTFSKTYINSKGVSILHTQWTQKGRLFLYDILKTNEILPLIERECD